MNASLWVPLVLASLLSSPVLGAEEGNALEVVDAAYVCMVNDAAYEKEQVRVDVDGKAYYGCCEMCKERIAKDASLRTAIDPVTKEEVDKAKAVIGADSYGRVFYFAGQENLEKFNKAAKNKK